VFDPERQEGWVFLPNAFFYSYFSHKLTYVSALKILSPTWWRRKLSCPWHLLQTD